MSKDAVIYKILGFPAPAR